MSGNDNASWNVIRLQSDDCLIEIVETMPSLPGVPNGCRDGMNCLLVSTGAAAECPVPQEEANQPTAPGTTLTAAVPPAVHPDPPEEDTLTNSGAPASAIKELFCCRRGKNRIGHRS